MKKRMLILSGILILILILIFASCLMSRYWLVVRSWTVRSDRIQQGFDLAVISDQHGNRFGKDNEKLIKKMADLHPDMILMAGDMIGKGSDGDEEICALVKKLSKISPVYYAYGNHEMDYIEADARRKTSFPRHLEEAGATVLEESDIDIKQGSDKVRIGGMYAYAFGSDGNDSAESLKDPEKSFLQEFENTDAFRIMISHRPDSFIFGDASSYWKIDLVVSGHDHGGQIVLPFLGGLFGGDQGFFPKYIHGLYQKDNLQLFITSGLGSQKEILPRFNNRPEIAVLHIRPAK